MKYLYMIWYAIKRFFVVSWNFLSLFFGCPYEEQAKKLGEWDIRGEDNPQTDRVAYRANKVARS